MINEVSKDVKTIWVIEDNERLRRYLVKYLNEPEDLNCAGSFSNCEEALQALSKQTAPDVILIDLGLPGMAGSEGIKEFRRRCPQAEPVVLTVASEREKVFEAISAGASGYLLKTASFQDIADACRNVAKGESSLDGAIARMMLNSFQSNVAKKADHNLTNREVEILELLADGLYCKEIAEQLEISQSTVNFHCGNLYKKLHVQSQRSAVNEAKKRGIL